MSFKRVEAILKELKATSHLNKFIELEVDDDTLSLMTKKEDLNGLLPYGLQFKFFAKIEKHKHSNTNLSSASPTESISVPHSENRDAFSSENSSPSDILFGTSESTTEASSSPTPSANSTALSDNFPSHNEMANNSSNTVPVIVDIAENVTDADLISTVPIMIDPFSIINEDSSVEKDPLSVSNSEPDDVTPSRASLGKVLRIASGKHLEAALKTYDQGKLVINTYKKQGFLDRTTAILLVDLILMYEFEGDPATKLTSQQFRSLSQSIVQLFPNESVDDYYVPFRSVNGMRSRARGRLLEKYEYRLKTFRAAGLIQSSRVKRKTTEQTISETVLDKSVEESLKWMRLNHEPPHKLMENWANTFKYRLNQLLNSTAEAAITEYFDTYPVLRIPDTGADLVELDFHKLYPEKADNFLNNWGEEADKILALAGRKYSKDANFRITVDQAQLDLKITGPENRKLVALFVLPLLFAAPGNVNRNKKNIPWKPSKLECVEGFIMRAADSGSYESKLLEKREFYLIRGITFQPTTVIVGPLDDISQCLVVIDNVKFSFDSPISAFNFCFKSYYTFHAKYPVECAQAYAFIQQQVFQIREKTNGRDYRPVADLIKVLNADSSCEQ